MKIAIYENNVILFVQTSHVPQNDMVVLASLMIRFCDVSEEIDSNVNINFTSLVTFVIRDWGTYVNE